MIANREPSSAAAPTRWGNKKPGALSLEALPADTLIEERATSYG